MATNDAQGFSLRIATGPKFGFKSDPDYIFMGDNDSTLIKTAIFVDDMFEFFPFARLDISDQSGELAERFGFVESLNFNIQIGDFRSQDTIDPNFYWTEGQLGNALLSDHISGTQMVKLLSKFRKDDSINSKAWGVSAAQYLGVNIKTPILDVTSNYKFKKRIIKGVRNNVGIPGEGPQNVDIFYQPNIFDFDYIRDLANIANDNTNSPYTTFINMQDEFYFTTIKDLESQQVLDDLKFKMEVTPFQVLESDQINRYMIMHGGVPVNEPNYTSLNFSFASSGIYNADIRGIKSFFSPPNIQNNEIGNPKNRKFYVRSQYTGSLKSIHDYGIIDNELQIRNLNGKIANRHLNSMTSNRIVIVVPFKSKAAAGRTVQLSFNNGTSDKYSRYAGKWTILRCEHHWNGKYRKLTDRLTLFRSGMDIPQNGQLPFTLIANDF